MTSNFQAVLNNLDELGLSKMNAYLPEYIDQINSQQLSFTEALLDLTERELTWRESRQIGRVIERARFPQEKTLKEFDFAFQPSINPQEIKGFKDLAFLEKHENLIFIGSEW